ALLTRTASTEVRGAVPAALLRDLTRLLQQRIKIPGPDGSRDQIFGQHWPAPTRRSSARPLGDAAEQQVLAGAADAAGCLAAPRLDDAAQRQAKFGLVL